MRSSTSILSITTSFLLFTFTAALAPRDTIEEITDTLLFVDTITEFEAARNAEDQSTLDWSSDGCSDSPDDPLGFNFLPPCQRHDFGYRNYKAQDRFTEANRLDIDNNLKADLYDVCNSQSNTLKVDSCKGIADVYYDAVREFGDLKKLKERK